MLETSSSNPERFGSLGMPIIIPRGPRPSRLMIIGDFPTIEDERQGSPFLGSTGYELDKLLTESGLNPQEAFITHALKSRPTNSDPSTLFALKKKDITPSHIFYRGKYTLDRVIKDL